MPLSGGQDLQGEVPGGGDVDSGRPRLKAVEDEAHHGAGSMGLDADDVGPLARGQPEVGGACHTLVALPGELLAAEVLAVSERGKLHHEATLPGWGRGLH